MKRKLGAMLLALCLMAGMTATAFAQGDPATEPAGAPPAPQETTVEFDSPDVFINIGEEQKLNVKVTPEVAPEEIQWKSSDEKIVTVDQEGKIHGVAGGEAFVSAEADGVKAEILVIVQVPVRFTADTFADLDQDEILATLKKVLGPMETEGMSIESKMMPNGQSMMLSHEIINKAWSVQLSVEANMLNADGSEAYSFRLEALENQTLSAPVDLAVDIHKASEDTKLARLFRGGKGLVVDVKGKTFPEGAFLYFGHDKYFGEETLTLYKVTGDKAVAVEEVNTYPENDIGLSLSSGGVYVLSDLTEEEILANAQAPETIFTAEDLKNNKQAVLDSLANTTEPVVCIMFTAADKAAVMPADVIEAAQANGKQLVAALQNEDGSIYMWLFNAYGQTTQQKAMDVKLYASFTDVSADAEMQALLGREAKAVRIDLAHEGALPQGTVVAFPALSVFADGETVYLYELKDGKLVGAGADGAPAKSMIEQGAAVYETTHCSSYIMTDVAQISGAAGETAGPSAASPQTGDAQASMMLWIAVAVLALVGAGTAALAKRR
ncbi:MAG: Ig-like domain-containing protein [Clostridiales bacterium]|nr:Ig-like domain-containing protein [Clostridiales bacterium]